LIIDNCLARMRKRNSRRFPQRRVFCATSLSSRKTKQRDRASPIRSRYSPQQPANVHVGALASRSSPVRVCQLYTAQMDARIWIWLIKNILELSFVRFAGTIFTLCTKDCPFVGHQSAVLRSAMWSSKIERPFPSSS